MPVTDSYDLINSPDTTTYNLTENDEYDSPWKEAVDNYFPEFIEFYFPKAYSQIDWSEEPVFLDKELRSVVRDAELGKRFVDKLVQIKLLTGENKWIYVHIEVQGTQQTEFAERMFVYNYRLYDKYRQPIASLAVLADENKNWKPTAFGYELLGCEITIKFPIAKLTDYHAQLETLKTSNNSFAIVTATHILTQQTRKDPAQRYEAKFALVKSLYQRNWNKQRIINLFAVIDWMMHLPKVLEQALCLEIQLLEEKDKMRYVTTVERFFMEKEKIKGMELGKEIGKEIGMELGIQTAEQKTLQRQIQRRFKNLPDWACERINQATSAQLEQWLDNILDAATIEDTFTNTESDL